MDAEGNASTQDAANAQLEAVHYLRELDDKLKIILSKLEHRGGYGWQLWMITALLFVLILRGN